MKTVSNNNAHVIASVTLSKGLKTLYRVTPNGIQLAIKLNRKKALLVTCQRGGWFTVYQMTGRTYSEAIKVHGLKNLVSAYPFLG